MKSYLAISGLQCSLSQIQAILVRVSQQAVVVHYFCVNVKPLRVATNRSFFYHSCMQAGVPSLVPRLMCIVHLYYSYMYCGLLHICKRRLHLVPWKCFSSQSVVHKQTLVNYCFYKCTFAAYFCCLNTATVHDHPCTVHAHSYNRMPIIRA